MTTSPSAVRVGLFVALGVVVLLAAVFLVGTQEGLFQSTFRVRAYFNSVEGVHAGTSVRLAGVDIGVVDNIEVSPADNKVILDLKLNTRVRSFIKKDSYATITPEGVVGSYYVDVTAGSRTGEQVEDGDVLQTKEATRLSSLLGSTEGILENIRRASDELTKTLSSINNGQGTLGRLIARDDVYNRLEHMVSRADSSLTMQLGSMQRLTVTVGDIVQRTDSFLVAANTVVAGLNEGKGTVGALLAERTVYDSLLVVMQNAVSATEEAKIGASRFAENMEALKHNWLFKGYFEDRGYWDKAEYEMKLEAKIEELKGLERKIGKQMEELKQFKEVSPN